MHCVPSVSTLISIPAAFYIIPSGVRRVVFSIKRQVPQILFTLIVRLPTRSVPKTIEALQSVTRPI